MKRKLLAAALILIVMSLSAYGTYAAYTSRVVAHNVITSGSVSIRLDEWMVLPDGTRQPFNDRDVLPGSVASKIVEVTNVGTADAYIRVWAEIGGAQEGHVTLDINTDCWTEQQPDGYYYYKEILPVGETTKQPLFTTVSFSGAMGNEYSNSSVTVTISAQAVQSANQNVTDVLEAKGWPAGA